MVNGNDVSGSTTLLANDPTNSLIRRQGATLMIGGDDGRSAGLFTGDGRGREAHLCQRHVPFPQGRRGPAGLQNISIIPWMTLGTYYHPGQGRMVTYDGVNGIRCLTRDEYYTGKVLGSRGQQCRRREAQPGSQPEADHQRLRDGAWDNTDIGPGSTLTISSGMLQFESGPASIGNGNPAAAGTIDFGPAEGVIWTGFETPYGPKCIGAVIAGSGGLTIAGNDVLILKAANTYRGKTCVGSGILQVGDGTLSTSKLGEGDVEVAAGGTLCIKAPVAKAIAETATVALGNTGDVLFGMMDLADPALTRQSAAWCWATRSNRPEPMASRASTATHKLNSYFTGSGILTVTGANPRGSSRTRKAGSRSQRWNICCKT